MPYLDVSLYYPAGMGAKALLSKIFLKTLYKIKQKKKHDINNLWHIGTGAELLLRQQHH